MAVITATLVLIEAPIADAIMAGARSCPERSASRIAAARSSMRRRRRVQPQAATVTPRSLTPIYIILTASNLSA
jgi:hypothetical protein